MCVLQKPLTEEEKKAKAELMALQVESYHVKFQPHITLFRGPGVCMLGGAGNKPDSIQNYTMIILIADQYIQGEKLG